MRCQGVCQALDHEEIALGAKKKMTACEADVSRLGERRGRLAQLVERFVYTEDVGSSSLSSPTMPLIRTFQPELINRT